MSPARRRFAARALLALCLLAAPAVTGRAQAEGSAYAFDKLVVFDSVSVDKTTFHSQRLINILSLDDRSALKILGRVAMPANPPYIAALSHHKHDLIVLLRDRVEIYELADPTMPRFVRSLNLGDQGFSSPGFSLIERDGEDSFILLNTRNTTELSLAGRAADWRVTRLPPPTSAQKAKMSEPPADVLASAKPATAPLLLSESERFRYDLAWTATAGPGTITHRKYVRKISRTDGRVIARFLLTTDLETVD